MASPQPARGGWALECKAAWVQKLLDGSKSVEVRQYPPPPELEGQRVWLLASTGPEGVATFGDSIAEGADGGSLAGWVLFDGAVEYSSEGQFAADQGLHWVPPGSPYAFQPGSDAPLFGWRVVASHRLPQPLPLPAMQRLVRSVYKIC